MYSSAGFHHPVQEGLVQGQRPARTIQGEFVQAGNAANPSGHSVSPVGRHLGWQSHLNLMES